MVEFFGFPTIVHNQRWMCTVAKKVKNIFLYILKSYVILLWWWLWLLLFIVVDILFYCAIYYFIALNVKIKPLMLDIL